MQFDESQIINEYLTPSLGNFKEELNPEEIKKCLVADINISDGEKDHENKNFQPSTSPILTRLLNSLLIKKALGKKTMKTKIFKPVINSNKTYYFPMFW